MRDEGRVQIATVVSLTPLRVRMRGSSIDVPVAFIVDTATVDEGDTVAITVFARRVTVIGRLNPA